MTPLGPAQWRLQCGKNICSVEKIPNPQGIIPNPQGIIPSGAPDAKLSVNYATYLTTVTKGKLGTYTYNLSRYIVQRQINYIESETVEIDTKKEEVPT